MTLAEMCFAILETVEECGEPAPIGPMYMAFAQFGYSLDTFESVVNRLVDAKLLTRSHNCLSIGPVKMPKD